MTALALPILAESGLQAYMREIRRFPMLEAQEEYVLAKAWGEHQDISAAHKLVTSHLRLVVKIAMGFRGYGLPMTDLIAEGNIGLMQAVKKFDPEMGNRLSTYAMWWIKAAIQEFILRSWSLVKMSTSAAQKKLFFNLRRLKNKIAGTQNRALAASEVAQIAADLAVPERDVMEMDERLGVIDQSLNAPVSDESESQYIDYLEDERANQEVQLSDFQELNYRKSLLRSALASLNEREREIFMARTMKEPATTLEELSGRFNVSRERIRQIENRAFEKVQLHVKAQLPMLAA